MRYLLNGKCRFFLRSEIKKATKISFNHLTPEIKLHLITPECELWYSTPDQCKFSDPYWGFYWGGGQALARHILDNKKFFKGKNVIDIGSGSGACAIAAAYCGSMSIIANDIDPVACEVISMNSDLNNARVHLNNSNILQSALPFKVDIVLVGDMFYDSEFGNSLFNWLLKCREKGAQIFIGDPGRHALDNQKKKELSFVAEYTLSGFTLLENNGFQSACVWKL